MRLKILVVISYASLALGSAILQKRASIEDSCKDVSSLMKLSLATVQTMGKTAASQVDWYMKNWKASNLNEEDRAKRKTIADAFRFIFGWEIDHQKGDKTTKYEFVRTTLPERYRGIANVDQNPVNIECSFTWLQYTHNGLKHPPNVTPGPKDWYFWDTLAGRWYHTDSDEKNYKCVGVGALVMPGFGRNGADVFVWCPTGVNILENKNRLLSSLLNKKKGTFSLDSYRGAEHIAFHELSHTKPGGATQDETYTWDGREEYAYKWEGVSRLVKTGGNTFNNADSVTAFAEVMTLLEYGFSFDLENFKAMGPE